ncbi:hypothetical protein COB64_03085 [Candidatus Wolfebacteria bacterium]|nr:MAG: hypothetical protein COB64_03085 [Candidatus Wolfebacteria bacterium]
MKLHVDYTRAESIFNVLLERLKEKKFPYDRDLELVPDKIFEHFEPRSIQHALFLFCACYYMRGGIKSSTAIMSLSNVCDAHPEFFIPEYISEIKSTDEENKLIKKMMGVLQDNGLAFNASVIPKFWIRNFQKLHTFWNGNPMSLLKSTNSYKKTCEIISNKGTFSSAHPNGFYGFQEKMVSMLIYFYIHAEIVDSATFPIPIDFHVLRIMVAHKIITKGKYKENKNFFGDEILKKARSLSVRYCKNNNISSKELSDALWFLSRDLCGTHPGNESHIGPYKARKTEIQPIKVIWNKSQVQAFNKSCLLCPIEKTCCFNIPSANYYRQGKLITRGLRGKPAQMYLFTGI